jgi:hypothetical protein
MQWRKILARPKCCRCLRQQQPPKPVHFIDLVEKERLTFIEYAGFKKEDDATSQTRRSYALSPEEHTRLKDIIISILRPKTPECMAWFGVDIGLMAGEKGLRT